MDYRAAELGEISDFEVTLLQFEYHGTAKVTVVEEEVYPVVVTEFVIVNLIADESEALAEGHDEVFDVVHDVLLYDASSTSSSRIPSSSTLMKSIK